MLKYKFKYRRPNKLFSFWRSLTAVGHRYDKEFDRMTVFFEDGLQEIVCWSECELKLGQDFMLATKDSMEKQVGQPIKVAGL